MAVRRSETLCFANPEAPDERSRVTRRLRQAGLIRRFGSGRYALTTTGERVRRKIVTRLRAAMEDIGAEAVSLPALQGRQPWEQSGRWQAFEGEMFTLRDREGRALCLAPTHEEAVVELVRGAVRSYQDLPTIVYQVGRKYRDDHARHGRLRTKDFTMKDAYSLHANEATLERTYRAVRAAYLEVFDGLGLDVVVASAGNSVMGGSRSEEFIAPVASEGTPQVMACRSGDCRFARTDEQPDWEPTRTGGSCPDCGGDLEQTPGVEVDLGERFAVSDRLGIPLKLVLGRRYDQTGLVEVQTRDGETTAVELGDIEEVVRQRVG